MEFFNDLIIIFCAALVSVLFFTRLRVTSIVAFMVAGVVIGPNVTGAVSDPSEFYLLAEFGVVLLLFSLGLEFSLPKLVRLKGVVFGVGGAQVVFCMMIFGASTYLWGSSLEASIVIAGALALSSTAIVTKELGEMREVHSEHGRLSVGVLLFQDLAAVALLIIVPVFGATETESSLAVELGFALAKGVALLIALLAVGRWILPAFFNEVASTSSQEVFMISTLVVVLVASWVTHALELSMALGAFITGMMLGESHFRHQVNSDIRGFKDVLLALFFVFIGMQVDIALLIEYWPRILFFTIGLVFVKFVFVTVLIRLFGYSQPTSLRTGINLAQAGEFGLALLTIAMSHGILPLEQASFITIVAVASMALSPTLIRKGEPIVARLTRSNVDYTENDEKLVPSSGHVILGGYGRVGKVIVEYFKRFDIPYIVIERDAIRVAQGRAEGVNITFGDGTRLDMLKSCHLEEARLAILSFDTIDDAEETLEHIRSAGCVVPVLVRTFESSDFETLLNIGANRVVPEMQEGAIWIAQQMVSMLELDEAKAAEVAADIRAQNAR